MELFNKKKKVKPLTKVDETASPSKQLAQAKKRKKEANAFKQQVLTTMNWCNIQSVENYEIILKRNKNDKTQYHVKGIKVKPHNIFLDTPVEVENRIDRLRMTLNKLKFKIYWGFVSSPVDIEDYKAELYQLNLKTQETSKKQMILDDLNKADWFENTHTELEFMLFIRDTDLRVLDKNLNDLLRETSACGFEPQILLKRDYLNYIAYLFDNKLLNATFFSQGVFRSQNEKYSIVDDKLNIENENHEDFLLKENLNNVQFATDDEILEFERSKIAPTSFVENTDYMVLGESFMSACVITELPPYYSEGLLCGYLNNPAVKVLMTTEHSTININAAMKKDYNSKLAEYQKTTDPTRRTTLKQALESQDDTINRFVANNDRSINLTIVLLICADSKEDLFELRKEIQGKLTQAKFKFTTALAIQQQVLRMTCPVLLDIALPKESKTNIGLPVPAEGVAGLYPFVFETLKDNKGFLLGEELINNGVILFDGFAYERPEWKKKTGHTRKSGSMIIVGQTGMGKSVTLNLTLRNDLKNGYNVVAIDPENKIFDLIKKYGGSTIKYGYKGNMVNIFDLRPLSSDADEDDEEYDREQILKEMWDTESAINFNISQSNQIFNYLFKEFSDEEAGLMGELIKEAYADVGITPNTYPTFRELKGNDMPTYSNVKAVLERKSKEAKTEFDQTLYRKLQFKLNRVCGEWSVYLDGKTTLNFEMNDEKKVVAFGTKHLQSMSDELQVALNHIMYQYAWSLCIDNERFSTFILDEAHVNILQPGIAGLTAQFVRRARKYHTCVKIATQQPHDFADPKILTHGKAIFDNCVYKLILHLEKAPADDIKQLITINENEYNCILNFSMGQALFVCADRRIPIRVLATEKEIQEFE